MFREVNPRSSRPPDFPKGGKLSQNEMSNRTKDILLVIAVTALVVIAVAAVAYVANVNHPPQKDAGSVDTLFEECLSSPVFCDVSMEFREGAPPKTTPEWHCIQMNVYCLGEEELGYPQPSPPSTSAPPVTLPSPPPNIYRG